jgi:hypothetical protein
MMHNSVRSRLRDPPPFQSPVNMATKAAFSAAFLGQAPPIVYDSSFYEKPHNIRKQLFWLDPSNRMYPKYPSVPEIQKEVINHYVSVHGIPKEGMLDFWADFVDCLLCCHNFEEEAPPPFKAWAYGRLCRYVLLERTKRGSALPPPEYDPVQNYSLHAH